MKKKTSKTIYVIKNSIILTIVISSSSLLARPVGKISFLIGNVQIKNGGSSWQSVRIGTRVTDKSKIQTGFNGKAVVTMNNGSRITVGKATLIGMEKYATGKYGSQTNVNLRIGSITASVSKRNKGRNYFRVRTPTAVAGVRGTVEHISYLPDRGTEVTLIESAADVINRQGAVAKVPQGTSASAKKGAPMKRPLEKAKMQRRVKLMHPGMNREERKGAMNFKGHQMGNPEQWKKMQKNMMRMRHRNRFDLREQRIMELEKL